MSPTFPGSLELSVTEPRWNSSRLSEISNPRSAPCSGINSQGIHLNPGCDLHSRYYGLLDWDQLKHLDQLCLSKPVLLWKTDGDAYPGRVR